MKQDLRTLTKSDLEILEKKLDKHFKETDKRFQVTNQRIHNAERSLDIRIVSSALDLRQRMEKSFQAELEVTVAEILQKVDEKLTKLKDLLFTAFDPLLQELGTREEDREITTHQISELKGKVNSYEERIKKLEISQRAT